MTTARDVRSKIPLRVATWTRVEWCETEGVTIL
jgi:hypothetical protein